MVEFDCPNAADRVAQAEEAKYTKYDALCERAQVKLTAFGVSSLGEAGRGGHVLRNYPQEGSRLAQEATERLSVACQRGMAAQLLQTMNSLSLSPLIRRVSAQKRCQSNRLLSF